MLRLKIVSENNTGMKKILLIEDNPEIRENTAEILELAQYKVFTAENGKAGVEIAQTELPDLIICDIMMPVLDGYGVMHVLHKKPDTRSIPFIFLTAKTEKADIRKGMELGADDYITKPFEETELLTAIETRLRKQEMLKENYAREINNLKDLIHSASRTSGIELISADREINTYKKKHKLYTEAGRPHWVFYIISGKVKTYRIHDDGKEYITGIHGPGEFIGYTSVLEDIPYSGNAEVLEDAEIMTIPKEDFMQLMYSDPGISGKFVKLLASSVEEKEQKLISLAYNSLRRRVAQALIQVSRKFTGSEAGQGIEISRETLAQVVGTAKESLIRTLSDFKEEKLIDIREGKILILNPVKLENLPY